MTGRRPRLVLNEPESVEGAIEECERLGRDEFLRKYGFRRARKYFLLANGHLYDLKAIWGVAFGTETPGVGPLGSHDFSGGESTVARKLESLGFTVVRGEYPAQSELTPVVLVENEVTVGGEYDHWADQTGVRYQYPNQYRNRVRPGRRFVYYRGVRRKGQRRGQAEYFGTGRIGAVWRDPSVSETTSKARWKWFCDLEDYQPFRTPVPAKSGGQYLESVRAPMGWRNGVRDLSHDVFRQILSKGDVSVDDPPPTPMPDPRKVKPVVVDVVSDVLLATTIGGNRGRAPGRTGRSRRSKAIGDQAEEVVYRWLRKELPDHERDSVEWIARSGKTPGWDIQYYTAAGELVAVEVKGTTAGGFPSVEVTANEWAGAERLRNNYWLYLVAACASDAPKIYPLADPYGKSSEGVMEIETAVFRLSLPEKSQTP